MNIIAYIGFLSSVVGLIGWLLPVSFRHPRVLHIIYGVFIVLLSATSYWYFEAYSRTKSVEKAANSLIESKSMEFTNEGFIQASLAFLEKNRDLYPDAYARAQIICQKSNCAPTESSLETIYLASTFEGLIKGIGTLEAN